MRASARALTIALLHPELGFGGSERLMLDAALELTRRGHRVTTLTSRCDPARAFADATSGALDVRVRSAWIPHELGRRARVPLAMLKMTALARATRRELGRVDVVLCDLVPQAVPIVRAVVGAPVVFYCHYPDSLLAPVGSAWYRIYRRGIDEFERRGLRACARILVNSRYTLERLREVVPDLGGVPCDVIAPGVSIESFERLPPLGPGWSSATELVILALGRFHADKDHPLAIETFAALRDRLPSDVWSRLRLVIAGGYDHELAEQRGVFETLTVLIRSHGLEDRVSVVRSPRDEERTEWLAKAAIVLHTAPAEHFGIVPVEAMAAGRPVVAIDNAGPTETVLSDRTGILCAPHAGALADALAWLIAHESAAVEMGQQGRAHAAARFSREAFGDQIEDALRRASS
jgi:alpha-1,3/alpha-1,6-mannosyltransferase